MTPERNFRRPLTPDERMVSDFDAQSIAANFKPGAQGEILDSLKRLIRPQLERDLAARYSNAGADIILDVNGNEVAFPGESFFNSINLGAGLTGRIQERPDGNELVIAANGGGADCQFDFLVSPCYLTQTLFTFTEGMTFTTASGCTYQGYSTIQGALTAAGALANNDSSTILICHGIYDEILTTTSVSNGSLILMGSGQGNTVVRPSTGAGPLLSIATQAGGDNAVVITGITFDGGSLSAGGVTIDWGNSTRGKMSQCHIIAQSAGVGLSPGNAGMGIELSQINFTGSGTGIKADSGTVPKVAVDTCNFNAMGVGIDWPNAADLSVTGTIFDTCTVGWRCDFGSAGRVTLTNNQFLSCGRGIQHTGGSGGLSQTIAIADNVFYECTTSAIDFGSLGGNFHGATITGNTFKGSGTRLGIVVHSTRFQTSTIVSNAFVGFTSGNEITGATNAQFDTANDEVAHNTTDSGATLPDTHALLLAGTFAPLTPQFVTMALDGTLPNERVLTTGNGITVIDGGANGSVTLRASRIMDADGDTGIQAEESADEDILRFDTAGAQRMAITADGHVVLGASELDDEFTLTGGVVSSTLTVRQIGIGTPFGFSFLQRSNTDAIGPRLALMRSKGSASDLIVASGTVLGQYDFGGFDGTDYELAARISVEVDGTPGAGDMPGRIEFHTTPDGSAAPVERMRLDAAGVLRMLAGNPIRFYDADSSNYASIAAAAAVTTDVDYLWPSDVPAAGEVLSVASYAAPVATLEWAAAGAGGGHTIQDDNSSMTARTNLSFQDGFIVTDDAGGNQTEIDLSYATTAEIADIATAEGAGTSITVSRGDHVHAAPHTGVSTTGMVQTLILSAGGLYPTETSGCAPPARYESPTNDVNDWVLDFDGAAIEYAFQAVRMPDNWDGGTLTARFVWRTSSSTATDTVRWGLQGRSYGNAETFDQAYGTAQFVDDDATATANQVLESAATAAITLGGTPAAGEYVAFRVQRDPTHANDDMTADARLLQVVVEYGVTALSA